MLMNKPSPDGIINVTVRDAETGKTKTRTFYQTTVEDIFRILKANAKDSTDQTGRRLDVTA